MTGASTFICYSSRSCSGDLVEEVAEQSGCCIAGGGLSFRQDTAESCQECFSSEIFELEGKTFYVGLFGNFEPARFFRINKVRLFVNPIERESAPFTLNVLGATTSHDAPLEVEMDADQVSIESDTIRDRAIIIQSSSEEPLSVVAFVEEFTSSDTFKVLPNLYLPVEYYEYYAISVPLARIPITDDYDYYEDELFEAPLGNSAIVIVTTEKTTELTITLTQTVSITAADLLEQIPEGKFEKDTPVTIQLPNEAQTLYIASINDLTGSRITSNKPIAFISGHECGTVPNNFQYCDQLVEQIPPTATWGKTFITSPIQGRSAGDIFKVIASRDNSVISVSCTGERSFEVLNLQQGGFKTINVSSTTYCYISSNQPVLLVQFSVVSSIDGVFEGDPFMVIVPPIEQYRSSYHINTFSNSIQAPKVYYINVLLPEGVDSNGLRLNGLPIVNETGTFIFTPVPCDESGSRSCGSSAPVKLPSDGQYSLTHENPSVRFNAIVYSLSFRAGNGYFAGMTQSPIALPTISFSSEVVKVFENETVADVMITRSGDLSCEGSFQIKTVQLTSGNAALFEEDFETVDTLINFIPGQVNVIVQIELVDDVFPEEVEEFEMFLSSSPGVFIDSPAISRVRILNDDPDLTVMNVSFSDLNIEVVEGVGVVNFVLQKTAGALGPVSVQIITMSGSATDGDDFVAVNQTVTFEMDDLERTVQTLIRDNSAVEDIEFFSVFLFPIEGLFPVAVVDPMASVFITDNDFAVIGFTQRQYSFQEGSENSITIEVLQGTLEDSVEVSVASVIGSGTAESGSDYEEVFDTRVFDSSTTSNSITVVIRDDNLVEREEFFTLVVSVITNTANIQILRNEATVTIEDIHVNDACQTTLHIMAFTSGLVHAGTDAGHRVELQASGQVRSLPLHDLPGDDALENKGDLWTFAISSFGFTDSCIRITEINRVSIIESSNDGWNIKSIVTLVKDSRGNAQLLTQNFDVYRWIDGNDIASRRRFELTFA